MTATRETFLTTYREGLINDYPWAHDAAKLARFMQSVEHTISTEAATWNHDSPTAKRAYKAIGGLGTYSRKALRALPAKEPTP